MKVQRLSEDALQKIINGQAKPATCVIKFYSNGCDFCHALSEHYIDIAEDYEDVEFFAFNVDDISEVSTLPSKAIKNKRRSQSISLETPTVR